MPTIKPLRSCDCTVNRVGGCLHDTCGPYSAVNSDAGLFYDCISTQYEAMMTQGQLATANETGE